MASTQTEFSRQTDSTKPVASENILNSCKTVEELERLTSAYVMISELLKGLPDDSCDKSMAAKFKNELLEIEAALQSLKSATTEAEELKNDLRAMIDDVKEHVRQNIDNYLLNITMQSARRCAVLGNGDGSPTTKPVGLANEPQSERRSEEKANEFKMRLASGGTKESEAENKRTNTDHNEKQTVTAVSAEEFRKVPCHLRGRLTVEKINETLDMLREVTQMKYRLLKKRKGLTIAEKDATMRMRSQTLPTLIGTRFISEDDIYLFKQIRLAKPTMSHLIVLRHLQKIREVREKNILRIILQS